MNQKNVSVIPKGKDFLGGQIFISLFFIFFGVAVLVGEILFGLRRFFGGQELSVFYVVIILMSFGFVTLFHNLSIWKSNCPGLVLTAEYIRILNMKEILWAEIEGVRIQFDNRQPAIFLIKKVNGAKVISWLKNSLRINWVLISPRYVVGYEIDDLYVLINHYYNESKKYN